jgi:hypothetical protein
VATNNDVLNLQNVNGILNNRKAVEIGMNNEVSNIAVNKQFARFKTGQTFGGDAAVGTSNPEESAGSAPVPVFQKIRGLPPPAFLTIVQLLLLSVSMSFMEVSDL